MKKSTWLIWSCVLISMSFINAITRDLCRKKDLKEKFNCENIYIWKSDQDDFISLSNAKFKNPRRNVLNTLEGKTVQIIATNMKPYIIYNNKTNELSGYLGDIWNMAEKALKFKTEIVGNDYDVGLKILSKQEADLMLAAGVIKAGLEGVKYSQPYLYNWYHLYIKTPEARASSSSYLKTLSPELWLASVLMFTVLTISLWFVIKYLHTFKLEPFVSIPSCFLSVCSGFLNQGFELDLQTYSCRIIMFFSFIPGYMLYSAINAVLVAKLAIFTVDLPFKSIEDIRIQKKWSLCLRSNSFVYNNFSTGEDPFKILNPEWKGIMNARGCLDINEQENLARILCNNEVAFLENRVVMATVIKNFQIRCSISNVYTKYFGMGNCYLVSKRFKVVSIIETFMKHMKSTGVIARLENKWMKNQVNYEDNKNRRIEIQQVDFNHISGIISFFCAMVLVSGGILGIEIIASKYILFSNKPKNKYIN